MIKWMHAHRRHLLLWVPLICIALIAIFYALGGRYVDTDDAYVEAAKAEISSNVSGQVIKIFVRDNQAVKRNDPLFTLDDRPFKIAVEDTKAKLVTARLQVLSLKATYQEKQDNVEQAKHTLTYQQQEYDRQHTLASSGISSQMQLNRATNNLHTATEQYAAAQQQLANVLASLGNDVNLPIDQHPIVQQAQSQLNEANLNLQYTQIIAPIDGVVAKVEQIQPGDYIKAGDPVFALISDKDIWLEANFKETDVTYMRPGQHAKIDIDLYPGNTFDGIVTSVSPGTGSTFSLLPPENATGNWVKIVQRVPVRLSILNPHHYFLSSGLSASVTVDTKHSRIFASDNPE
jgi:membrane fusion protein (multidrug efflux system)